MPLYGPAPWVAEAIRSLAAQLHTEWHLYLIQDGPEGQAAYDKALSAAQEQQILHKLTPIQLSNRSGAPQARMYGIEQGTGSIISFIDQDDQWAPQKLQAQVRAFMRLPDVALVHTDAITLRHSGSYTLYSCDNHNKLRSAIDYYGGTNHRLAVHFMYRNSVRICSVAIRRAAFEQIGGFDGTLFGGEEEEFLARASASGLTFLHIPYPLLYRRFHPDNTSSKFVSERLLGKWQAQTKLVNQFPDLRPNLASARRRLVLIAIRRALANGDWTYPWQLAIWWRQEGERPKEAALYAALTLALARVSRIGANPDKANTLQTVRRQLPKSFLPELVRGRATIAGTTGRPLGSSDAHEDKGSD